jgi:hypothetical protein
VAASVPDIAFAGLGITVASCALDSRRTLMTVYGARAFAAFQEFYRQRISELDGHQPAG